MAIFAKKGFREAKILHDGKNSGKGYRTGSIVTVPGSTMKLHAASYYDIQGRVTKQVASNLLGGYETTTSSYTFTGNPSAVTHVHTASGKPTRTEVYAYTYDERDRTIKVEHTLNGVKVTLVTNSYDDLGRLLSKSPHGSAANRLTYAYNVRGWLTGISGTRFTQNLYYNTGNGAACYNGNISSITWKAGSESTLRGYKFTYDGLSRLLNATYGEGTSINTNTNRFNENITGYDKNGNIKALQRYGQTSSSGYGLIDNLTCTLNGNQLNRVDDAVTASAYNNGFEFRNGASAANEYAYDANGNLTKDSNKGISNISYNILNLPGVVMFSDGSTVTYTYSADGTKLRTVHKTGSATTTTDYCGNVIYENNAAKLLLKEEGYVSLSDGKYHYYLQDHQGNNRVVINQSGGVEETNHNYPFGGVFASSSSVQAYKYNGKEYDSSKGLNWYDYGARHYDAALGRFTTNDLLAEKYYEVSSYVYCLNNPVMYVDPSGKDIVIWYRNSNNKQVSFNFNGANAMNAPNNPFVKNVIRAYTYNQKNGGGQNLKEIATNRKLIVGIVETDKDNRYELNGFIRFNPKAGLKLDDGHILSPATGLEHEAAHAFNHKTHGLDEAVDKQYQTKEERMVIKGSELKTAKANGELPLSHKGRKSHSEGTWVVTKSVISHNELDPKQSEQLRNRIKEFKKSWTSE